MKDKKMYLIVSNKHVELFISELEHATIAKILRIITALECCGTEIGMPYVKKINNQLYEIRVRGIQEVRIIFTIVQFKIYLLHGFIKKTNKIPIEEIQTAKKRLTTI